MKADGKRSPEVEITRAERSNAWDIFQLHVGAIVGASRGGDLDAPKGCAGATKDVRRDVRKAIRWRNERRASGGSEDDPLALRKTFTGMFRRRCSGATKHVRQDVRKERRRWSGKLRAGATKGVPGRFARRCPGGNSGVNSRRFPGKALRRSHCKAGKFGFLKNISRL